VTLTGAAGRLGEGVCRWLAEQGHAVRAVDRIYRRDLPVRVDVEDLLQREACYRVIEGAEAVVHLANHTTPRARAAQTVFNENVTTNMNVFQAARETGVRKIVFASSIQVCTGSWPFAQPGAAPFALPYLPLDGDAPAQPANPYALSKHCSEAVLAYQARLTSVSCVAVRFPGLLADAVRPWIAKNREAWNADGAPEAFAFLSMSDAATLIGAILAADLPGFRIYLPAARANRLGLPAADVIRAHYPNVPLRRPLEAIDSLVDVSRITRETGWTPAADTLP